MNLEKQQDLTPLIQPGFEIRCLDHGFVRYIDHMGTDQRILEAARISYKSPSKGEDADKKLLSYLWKNKHTSPFEMVKITLNIKMPIFVMRQYVRHRMQNLNEVSARYTELPNEFYIPGSWRKQDTKNKQGSTEDGNWDPVISKDVIDTGIRLQPITATNILNNFCETAYEIYRALISAGVAREQARMVLPINIYTEIYASWDLKNLLHFITLREDAHAQAEIVAYAKAIKQILQILFPWTIEAFEKYKFVLHEN